MYEELQVKQKTNWFSSDMDDGLSNVSEDLVKEDELQCDLTCEDPDQNDATGVLNQGDAGSNDGSWCAAPNSRIVNESEPHTNTQNTCRSDPEQVNPLAKSDCKDESKTLSSDAVCSAETDTECGAACDLGKTEGDRTRPVNETCVLKS